MNVMQKIAQKRKELGIIDQPRKKSGKWKKKRDPFLLWGEYPHGWIMIKDFLLCIALMNTLISQAQNIDISSLLAPQAITIINEARIQPAKAQDTSIDEKEPEIEKMEAKTAIVTAYNSEESQTDGDPFTMANGKKVYDGAIANNCLAFGDKVVLNGKTYTVEDRMNSRYGCEYFDIWMPSYDDAIRWGRRTVEYEIVK